MPEEGKGTEGGNESAADSPQSEAQFFAANFIPAEASEAHLGWVEAVSQDERGQNSRRAAAPSKRSQASARAMYRAQQDWQRTVRGIKRQSRYTPPSEPREPYAKGHTDSLWDKFWTAMWKVLGVE
jgi:hypothetical protein